MPADGGVAGHLPERLDGVREQQRPGARARGGQGGLGAGVAAAHYDHVESVGKVHDLESRKARAESPENQEANSTRFASPDPPLFHVEQRDHRSWAATHSVVRR